jgi:hypothetical protein
LGARGGAILVSVAGTHALVRLPQFRGARDQVGRRSRGSGDGGQSLVEFALVVPIFLLLIMGLIEYGFLYNNVLTVQYASRQGVSIAAEAGAVDGADCSILKAVEAALQSPVNRADVEGVTIFESDFNGNPISGRANQYVRTGALYCPGTGTQPYTLVGEEGYPQTERGDTLAGGLDLVGVFIDYTYHGMTPIGAGRTWSVSDGSTLRMEPKQ